MKDKIKQELREHIRVIKEVTNKQISQIEIAANIILESLLLKGKVVLFGNGGSAADAQHIAAEFVGRFLLERKSFSAICLKTDPSVVTAIANDYGYNHI